MVGIEMQALASPFPLPTMASGSDSSDGLWYSLRFLFFMGLKSSALAQLEEFSTMTDLGRGDRGRGRAIYGETYPPLPHPGCAGAQYPGSQQDGVWEA